MLGIPKILTSRNLCLTLGADKPAWLAAALFVLVQSAFEWFVLGSGFPHFLKECSDQDDPLFLVIAVAYVAASFYVFFVFILVALTSKWPYRIAYFLVFGIATVAEYSYATALGRFTTYYDVVSAFGVTQQQASDSVAAYFSWIALVPCLCLIGVSIWLGGKHRQFGHLASWIVLPVVLIFYVHLYYINLAFFDRQFVSNSSGSFFQTATDFLIIDPFGSMGIKKRDIVKRPDLPGDSRPDNNVVFIFDESVMGDHLSLNGYSRATTPYLETLAARGVMQNWGIAVSVSTISRSSYDAMIVGATPEILDRANFNDINAMPTIFQYAKAMNYRTFMIDGQMKSYWAGIPDDENYIDSLITMNELDSPDRVEDWQKPGSKITNEDNEQNALKQWEIDPKIALIVNQIFSGSTGNFIFIYKRGVHFPYEKNYPENEAIWQPAYHFKEQYEIPAADQFQAIVNSYDNAVRYNLDDFFKRLAPDYSNLPNNTVIVYTSDHGESFFANGKAGHGGNTKEEANVPLFIFGLTDKAIDTDFKATHANVFTTLLDLFGYPKDLRDHPYSMSLFDGKASMQTPRLFNPPDSPSVRFD